MDRKANRNGGIKIMSDSVLLARIEAMAVETARLTAENADMRERLSTLPDMVRQDVYRSMSRAAVNCGSMSECWLAFHRMKDNK
jgi:hypothetical protein